jgi:hypothetical protein
MGRFVAASEELRFEAQNRQQLYRDRDDAENGFDELKNPWGWAALRHRTSNAARPASAVALIYNWWNWYCRASRMEAITSQLEQEIN